MARDRGTAAIAERRAAALRRRGQPRAAHFVVPPRPVTAAALRRDVGASPVAATGLLRALRSAGVLDRSGLVLRDPR
eukprot:gene22614-6188_t